MTEYRLPHAAAKALAARQRNRQVDPEERLQRIAEAWDAAGVPQRFVDVSFETFNPTACPGLDSEAYHVAKQWAQDGRVGTKTGLLLLGPPGTGKTSLALAAMRAWIERTDGRASARYYNLPRHISSLQHEFGAKTRRSTPLPQLALEGLLLLDDVGKHTLGEWLQQELYGLVDDIWSAGKPMLATTNLTPDEFRKLDRALISRILGTCHFAQVRGRDHRME